MSAIVWPLRSLTALRDSNRARQIGRSLHPIAPRLSGQHRWPVPTRPVDRPASILIRLRYATERSSNRRSTRLVSPIGARAGSSEPDSRRPAPLE